MPTPVTSITLARPQRGLALPPRLLLPRLLLLLQLLLGLTTICTTVSAGTVTKLTVKRNVDVAEHGVKLDKEVLDKALITANIARLHQDCGSIGRFGFCPRNGVCLHYGHGEWALARRRSSPCDPANDADYGCHCKYAAFSNGSCSSERCIDRMRRFYQEYEHAGAMYYILNPNFVPQPFDFVLGQTNSTDRQ